MQDIMNIVSFARDNIEDINEGNPEEKIYDFITAMERSKRDFALSISVVRLYHLIKPEPRLTTARTLAEIVKITNLHNITDEELQILRNKVVMFTNKTYKDEKAKEDDMIRMSMFTSVIDCEKYNRGLEV